MNKELKLYSIVRPKKLGHKAEKPHKVFENKLQRDFSAEKTNQKWCIDFTYLFLKNREVRYNCSIIELFDRIVISGITSDQINSSLAIDRHT